MIDVLIMVLWHYVGMSEAIKPVTIYGIIEVAVIYLKKITENFTPLKIYKKTLKLDMSVCVILHQ